MEIDYLEIISDYKEFAMPLDMVANKHGVSMGYVLNILHYWSTTRPYELMETSKIIKEME
jgi:hypothetical protein